ncbi:MAG TPA: POTRA domain-containing protein, partial [Vicinamibacterales bacterium]|nr:POTRA domain-containing protein [Vicinamibacterales bacterium]
MLASALLLASAIAAQPQPATVCGLPVPPPAKSPPADSGPVIVAFLLCFEKQGGVSMIEPQTYLHYIELRPSEPSRDRWTPYDDAAEAVLRADFRRLWDTGFLDDLTISAHDYTFPNGVAGKIVVFNIEERQRIRIVDFDGVTRIDQSAIDERLKDKAIAVRLDSFLDLGALRRVAAAVAEVYEEKGFQFAEVRPEVKEVPGPGKLVHITFVVTEGPMVAIRDVEFLGNREIDDAVLARALKQNKAQGLLTILNGKGTFKEDKFAEDAQSLVDFYRDRGYINAQIGQPVLKALDDSADGRTRWVQMRVPVTEGKQFRVGNVTFDGNTIVKAEALRQFFKLKSGETYNQQAIRKGLEAARDAYGAGGYFEFTGYPDLHPRDGAGDSIVDITIRVDEGKQYFINRITFSGNTHTRDAVIRRELAIVEAGVFNTAGLKNSIRRLNQLGYFKALEADDVS